MEKEEIDFALLQTLLVPRKQIERMEVSRILRLEEEDEEDSSVLKELMRLLGDSGCRKYLSFKSLPIQRLQEYISRKGKEGNFGPLALGALEKLHVILRTEIPEEFLPRGGEERNLVKEFESLTLCKGPSGVKLSDPESSVGKGLMVDISLNKKPLTGPAHPTGTALMNFCVRAEITDLSRFLSEGSYTMKEIGHPSSMIAKSADASAKTVLPENYGKRRKLVVANPQSKPELLAGIRWVGHPTKSDEWKSYPNEAIEELVQTSLGHIQSSFFREKEGAQSWRFYEKVPWGLALLSCACSVVCVFSVEMVGVLLFSIYGGGCSVGTDMYKEYLAVLEREEEQHAVVDLKHTTLVECQMVGKKVQWTSQPVDEFFYKIIRYDLYHKDSCPEHGIARADNWRRLFDVYERYSTFSDNMELPNALVPATLLYGEFQVSSMKQVHYVSSIGILCSFLTSPPRTCLALQVAVRMVFVRGSALEEEEELREADLDDLCTALVFLAKQGLVYTDFRPQNVIRSQQDLRIRLIDYDDMKVVSSLSDQEREYDTILKNNTGPGFDASVRRTVRRAISQLRGDS